MRSKTRQGAEPKARRGFNVEAYLEATGPARTVARYKPAEVVFSQGDAANDVRYIQKGAMTLSVLSRVGRSRVNFFMNKFRKLALIGYSGELKSNSSLLSIVLHD